MGSALPKLPDLRMQRRRDDASCEDDVIIMSVSGDALGCVRRFLRQDCAHCA